MSLSKSTSEITEVSVLLMASGAISKPSFAKPLIPALASLPAPDTSRAFPTVLAAYPKASWTELISGTLPVAISVARFPTAVIFAANAAPPGVRDAAPAIAPVPA
ncbi:MAG: hypothetical protein KDC49_19515 [Saprospiraceae bacterium]|nr:hypothetical protein [Saprospiraceae bacterium]